MCGGTSCTELLISNVIPATFSRISGVRFLNLDFFPITFFSVLKRTQFTQNLALLANHDQMNTMQDCKWKYCHSSTHIFAIHKIIDFRSEIGFYVGRRFKFFIILSILRTDTSTYQCKVLLECGVVHATARFCIVRHTMQALLPTHVSGGEGYTYQWNMTIILCEKTAIVATFISPK